MPAPSAEAQLAFLVKVQRLFAEGDFTATYKFALLIALADLAVERGQDDGRDLLLTTRDLGERFIQLYWRHVTPYGTGRPGAQPGILIQNSGRQATVVAAISAFRAAVPVASPQTAARFPGYEDLLRVVSRTVSDQPLNYLQNFGGGTDEFLYERAGPGRIRLRPGAAYCLRRFQPLVQQLARSHWVRHIKGNRQNHGVLGDADDLEEFLFLASRQSLLAMADGLRRIDGPTCFYCGSTVTSVDVDHFVPFSQYPRDLAHNLVLTHATCNRSKSDMLAAKRHLERWLRRLEQRGDDLAEVGQGAGLVVDPRACRAVASWSYSTAAASRSSAWVSPNTFEAVDVSYMVFFDSSMRTTCGKASAAEGEEIDHT